MSDDVVLSRATVAAWINRLAEVYTQDGEHRIGAILRGLARQVGQMKPEIQEPLSLDELDDLIAADGEDAKVWLESREKRTFQQQTAWDLRAKIRVGVFAGKYNKDFRAWMTLPTKEEMRAAKWAR